MKRQIGKKKKIQIEKTPLQKIGEFLKNLFFAAIAALLIKTFFIETSRVPTGSMETTIKVGDFLFVNKFIYGMSSPRNIPFTNVELPYFSTPQFSDPEKGDIVVFEFPGMRDELKPAEIQNYVKRCVAEPGDTLEIINKVVFVNGKELPIPANIRYENPYIAPAGVPRTDLFPKNAGWNQDNYGPIVMPQKGEIVPLTTETVEKYRMLINRDYGKRVVGLKDGKVTINGEIVDSYEIKDDCYFMMGDNRDNSLDSRSWGFVPREKIVGQALMIYWSWDKDIPFSDLFKLLGSVRVERLLKIVH